MSDFPNGNPPGQNNLDATVERYVDPKNDPSAGAPKNDDERNPEDGVEVKEPTPPEVQKELDEASKNVVEPSSVETGEEESGSEDVTPDEGEAPAGQDDDSEE